MPAKNPRLTITMQPSLHALFRRLSDLTGQSQSALIAELLDGSQLALTRVVKLLEASNDAKESLRGFLASEVSIAQDRIESQLGLALEPEQSSIGFDILAEVEKIKHRLRPSVARKGSLRASVAPVRTFPDPVPTPLSNRGVRSLTSTIKTIAVGLSPTKPKPLKHGVKNRGGSHDQI